MSQPGNRRDRKQEATEVLRSERQRKGLCIDCGKPAKTQRCQQCRSRVEAATERYSGQGRRGPAPRLSVDLRDIRYAMESLGKAHAGISAVSELGALGPRKRDELLEEPMAQVNLADRFLREVLQRAGLLAARAPRRSSVAHSKPRNQNQLVFRWAGVEAR